MHSIDKVYIVEHQYVFCLRFLTWKFQCLFFFGSRFQLKKRFLLTPIPIRISLYMDFENVDFINLFYNLVHPIDTSMARNDQQLDD